jgi:zinc transport system substrate-binding protein
MKLKTGRRRVAYTPVCAALAAMILALMLFAAGCGAGRSGVSGRMKVAATIIPLADFCRNVGGDLVDVKALIPAQAGCGHTYEPTPGEVRFLAEARVLVMNGLNLESWATDVMSEVGSSKQVTVTTSDAIPGDRRLPATDKDESEKGKPGEGIYDPHVWLDPSLAIYQVEAIRDGFIKADPAHREEYARNAEAYIGDLKALDNEIKGLLTGVREKDFIATHPTWTYFARHYGLVQAGEVEELPGREPGIARINALVDQVRARGIKAVLAEPQISPRAIEVLAEDAGPDVRVVTVDPVGDPDKQQVDTYIKLMRHNALVLEAALR